VYLSANHSRPNGSRNEELARAAMPQKCSDDPGCSADGRLGCAGPDSHSAHKQVLSTVRWPSPFHDLLVSGKALESGKPI
jgi:hypothetical protein